MLPKQNHYHDENKITEERRLFSQSDSGANETRVNTVLGGQLKRPAAVRLTSCTAARARPAPRNSRRRELLAQPEESGEWTARREGQVPEGWTLGSRGESVGMGESPALWEPVTPKETGWSRGHWEQLRARLPAGARPPHPLPAAGPGRRARWGGGAANRRILPQAGVHLALVGPGLPVAPVFLVHELVLVVLIHVYLPEPGRRHRVLRHPRSGPAAKASPRCCLYLSKPNPAGTRRLPPSLPSSAQRRRPAAPARVVLGLRAGGASSFSGTRSPPTLLHHPHGPLPARERRREGARWTQCAGADSLQERGGAGWRRRGREGAGQGRAESGAAGRGKRRLGVHVRHVIPGGFP